MKRIYYTQNVTAGVQINIWNCGLAWHVDSSSVVWTVIDNCKLANQIARLVANVVKQNFEKIICINLSHCKSQHFCPTTYWFNVFHCRLSSSFVEILLTIWQVHGPSLIGKVILMNLSLNCLKCVWKYKSSSSTDAMGIMMTMIIILNIKIFSILI